MRFRNNKLSFPSHIFQTANEFAQLIDIADETSFISKETWTKYIFNSDIEITLAL